MFLSPVARSIVDFVKYSLEWTKNDLIDKFQQEYQNPLEFSNIIIATSIQDMDYQVRNNPSKMSSSAKRVIVTTESHLEYGFGRELLTRFGCDKYSAVIFTDRCDMNCDN